jgi:hypothetical protein
MHTTCGISESSGACPPKGFAPVSTETGGVVGGATVVGATVVGATVVGATVAGTAVSGIGVVVSGAVTTVVGTSADFTSVLGEPLERASLVPHADNAMTMVNVSKRMFILASVAVT